MSKNEITVILPPSISSYSTIHAALYLSSTHKYLFKRSQGPQNSKPSNLYVPLLWLRGARKHNQSNDNGKNHLDLRTTANAWYVDVTAAIWFCLLMPPSRVFQPLLEIFEGRHFAVLTTVCSPLYRFERGTPSTVSFWMQLVINNIPSVGAVAKWS